MKIVATAPAATARARRKPHCNFRHTIIHSALICLGLSTAFILPHPGFAQSSTPADAQVRSYDIAAGNLEDALNQFGAQADVRLSFDSEDVKGKAAPPLRGKFTVQVGLSQLLEGSGLDAVAEADGYAVKKSVTAGDQPPTLPSIKVSASAVRGPTDGYQATKAFSAIRTDTPLRDVPQSITVVTRDLIRDQAMQNMNDVVRYVPGVGISQGEGNRDAVIFRGNNSTGDFFIDGLRDDAQYLRDLYNIDRVEVLKGSNGMIFGRGGAGGAINRVSKEANWAPINEVVAQYGSFSHKRIAVDLGKPINDVVAFRLNGMFEHSDSYRDGVDIKRGGVNPTLTIKPSARTKIVMGGEYFFDDRTADRGIPSFGTIYAIPATATSPGVPAVVNSGRPSDAHWSTFFGDPDRSRAKIDVGALNALIEHTFENEVMFRNTTRYANYDKFYQNVYPSLAVTPSEDAAGTVPIQAYNNATDRTNVFNRSDFVFKADTWGVKHEFMTGVEYGHQVSDNFRNTGFFNNTSNTTRVPFLNPITHTPLTFRQNATDADNHGVVDTVGVYIQDQITILPQFRAVLGIRYDNFDTRFANHRTGDNLHVVDNLVSPRAGLIYKPIDMVSFYGNYSLSYVPRAGDQLASLTLSNAALQPERFRNIEFGAKWDVHPDLSLATAIFQLDRTNVIIPVPGDPSRTMLADGARTRGAELSLMGRVTPQWSVMGGYAYMDSELTATSAVTAQKGAAVPQVPRHTASMWNRYDFTPWLGLGLGVVYRSSMYATTDNAVLIPGFTRLDGAMFVRVTKMLRLQANIENLANVDYITSVNNDDNIMPGAPRIYRLTGVFNF